MLARCALIVILVTGCSPAAQATPSSTLNAAATPDPSSPIEPTPTPTYSPDPTALPNPTASPVRTPALSPSVSSSPEAYATFGPNPTRLVNVTVREHIQPVTRRDEAATVWTGSELLVWGGWIRDDKGDSAPANDGAMYSPADGTWTSIPAAPINGQGEALASWTGSDLFVLRESGGEDEPVEEDVPGLAAYSPAKGSWRTLPAGPLKGRSIGAATWTGSEWWIAAFSDDEGGAIGVAAYDPAADSWRDLPMVEGVVANAESLLWTGSEMLLSTGDGLFSLPVDGAEWIPESFDGHEPMIWTGELLIGLRIDALSDPSLNNDFLVRPVAWDPSTRSTVELPAPPRSARIPVLADTHVMSFYDELALDLDAGEWMNLDVRRAARDAMDMEFSTMSWAGDRLFVWGGSDPCDHPPTYGDVFYELIPQWDAATAMRATFSQSVASGNAIGSTFAC